MHKYFFTTKDAFISSGSNETTGEDFKDKNTGQDEVLELKKVFYDRTFSYPTRILLQFDADEMENYIDKRIIPIWHKGDYIICDGERRECFDDYKRLR